MMKKFSLLLSAILALYGCKDSNREHVAAMHIAANAEVACKSHLGLMRINNIHPSEFMKCGEDCRGKYADGYKHKDIFICYDESIFSWWSDE